MMVGQFFLVLTGACQFVHGVGGGYGGNSVPSGDSREIASIFHGLAEPEKRWCVV